MLAWRYQETRTPVTPGKIVLPPLAMSTGFLMFVAPAMRVPWSWGAAAFLAGALLLSYPLERTSSLVWAGEVVVMRRSQSFLLILLGLLAMRVALHDYVGHLLSVGQTASVFFVLAFGMILRWRIGMLRRYRALVAD